MVSPFIVETRPVPGPATHVIVIGVGDYPHLPGGRKRQVEKPEGMAQLTSPPVSARALATWLIEKHHHPERPLASVALLLAERGSKPFRNPRSGRDVAVQRATIDNIGKALTEWRKRGDAAADQRLVFYFCGHGMAKGTDLALLAADYGENDLNPLDGAVDFRNFLAAMELSKAREQVYLIDACRVHSGSLLRAGQYNGRPIFQPDLAVPPVDPLRAPVFYATLPGTAAYGRPRQPSTFTEALLHGLDGAGADDSSGDWRVTSMRLKEALDFYLERALKEVGRSQIPATDNQVPMDLHTLAAPPTGTAIIVCDPFEATDDATLSYTIGGRVQRRRGTDKGEWVVELPVGSYDFSAEFEQGPWRAETTSAYIRPVYRKVPIKASR